MNKLVIATDAWHPQVNGVVRVLDRLRRETPAYGLEIDVVSPDGFPAVPLPTYGEIKLALCSPSSVGRRIEAAGAEFVHIPTEGPIGMAARRWCRRQGRGFTTSFHTRFPEYLASRVPVPTSVSYAWLRRFHNSGLATMVSTQTLADELSGRGFRKLAIWPRAVDTGVFCPGEAAALDHPRPIFLYVGRVAVEKNVAGFLALDLPGTKVVVGDGPQRAELERRFPEAKFLGVHTGDDLVRLYRAADVFVFPSRTDTLGLVSIEAMGCGIPVAAHPVPGPRDVVGDSGAGVLDEDLRAAALAALDIPREACRERALQFNWSRSAEAFTDIVRTANGRVPGAGVAKPVAAVG
ncbi:glycosyltransferase family 1 protein [Microbaculum marinum]|uniref:Glycosyltransferase family 1 protein n=1 Tax=Microbaculum marinum TaxID=1764581 RepID=A0AAW9RSJ4_9HYPH